MKALFYCTRAICSLSCSLWSAAQQLVLHSLKYISITKHLTACVLKLTSTAKSFAACILKPASVTKQLGVKTLHYAGTIKHLLHKSLQRMPARVRAARQGFSLVELMIVVAIIGVLTAIAIPNFQAFQARSRQSEAKAALTSIYTAEQAFHSQWEVYAMPFAAIGYIPSGDYRYAAGFDTDGHTTNGKKLCNLTGGGDLTGSTAPDLGCGPAPGRKYTGNWGTNGDVDVLDKGWNTEEFCDSTAGSSCNYVGINDRSDSLDIHASITTALGINTFLAAATGDPLGEGLAKTEAVKIDAWTVDENKNLLHVNDALNN